MAEPPRRDLSVLRADCGRCAGLCCVAPAFGRSADFALDKPAGTPCPHLADDFACAIHHDLRARGFPGCATYDCFGAGQHVTQDVYAGATWLDLPRRREQVFTVFEVVRDLHELLWYLTEAAAISSGALHDDVSRVLRATEVLASGGAGQLEALDVDAHRAAVVPVLRRVSEAARATEPARAERRGADLAGADLRSWRLRGADLRGASLLAADLRGVDLTLADVTGADLRGADLRGADLSATLFMSQVQASAARGDAGTRLPSRVSRPEHWCAPS